MEYYNERELANARSRHTRKLNFEAVNLCIYQNGHFFYCEYANLAGSYSEGEGWGPEINYIYVNMAPTLAFRTYHEHGNNITM